MSRLHTHSPQPSAPQTQGRTIHWATTYDFFVSVLTLGKASKLRAHTADLARLTLGEAVLDVGCGTGDLTREVYKRVGLTGQVAGIDASPEMIARARRKAQRQTMSIDFRLEAVEAMSFADNTFDAVVSSLVFHHLPTALKQQGLTEIRRVLKPNGRILIVDFLRSERIPPFHSALEMGLQDLPPLLTDAGFLQVEWQRIPFLSLGALHAVATK